MKKTFTLLVMLLACQMLMAQDHVQELFNKYRNDSNAKYEMFTQELLKFPVSGVNDSRAALVKKVDYIKIIMFTNPTKEQRTNIPEEMLVLQDDGYRLINNAPGNGEVNTIAIIIDENMVITDAVLFQAANATGMLMRIVGKLTADEMTQLGDLLQHL